MDTENQELQPLQPEENKVEQEVKTLEITDEIKNNLIEAGRWSKFLAILGFIFMALMIMMGFFLSVALALIPKTGATQMPFPPFLMGVFYLVMAGIYFLPLLYLYRFSSGIKQALHLKNQDRLANAFFNLKAHYRFIGILMIVMLALYVLVFVVMIFAGLFAGLSGMGGIAV